MYIHMETKIQKWGNSLGVRLPKDVVEKSLLREGSIVVVSETKEGIMIKKATRKKLSLQELVKKIDVRNIHHETTWGEALGKEVW
jgi:antitoxin MazE